MMGFAVSWRSARLDGFARESSMIMSVASPFVTDSIAFSTLGVASATVQPYALMSSFMIIRRLGASLITTAACLSQVEVLVCCAKGKFIKILFGGGAWPGLRWGWLYFTIVLGPY